MIYSKLFEDILAKPGLYVGNRSIIKIKAFLDGYQHAKWEAGEALSDDLYDGFQAWIEKRFKIQTSHGWVDIIQFMSGDEIHAFEQTKELWEEYKAEFQQAKAT